MAFVYASESANLPVSGNVDRGAEAVAGAVASQNENILFHLAPAEIGRSRMAQVVIQAVDRNFRASHHGTKVRCDSAPLAVVDPIGNRWVATSKILRATHEIWCTISGCA